MKRKLTAGQTSVSLPIFIQDTSSTTGGGLSGLTFGTSGLVAEYRRRGQSSWTAITLTSKTLGTWTSGGFVADGALAGAYELDLPDAVCASGARWVAVRLRGAANMLPCLIEIELDACDYQVDALGAVKPTTAGRTLTVDTSGQVTVGGYAAGQVPLQPTVAGRTLAVDASGLVTDTAGTTTLLSRLTSTRAGLLDNLDVAISVIQSQITALNNLSAKANWFGSALLEIPDSGTRAYVFELVIKDDEDKLVNLDTLPTITLTNAAGTDRSALITTGIALAATGRYTLTITVGTSTNNEALLLKATGTVSGETRYAVLATQVVDYDSGALINSIYTRLGVPATSSIAGDIAASKTVIDSIKTDTGTTIPSLFTTLTTKVRKFFQLIARKDTAIATDNATELSELNANGGSGAGAYSQATDSLEAIRDRGDAAWVTGGGGGGGSGDWTDNEKTAIRSILGIPSSGTTPADPTTGILDTIRDQVVANGAALAGTPIQPTSRIASGGTITAYIGDDFKVRSGTQLQLSVSDVGGALNTKWSAIGAANLYFGASREGAEPGSVNGTVASITSVGSGASQTCRLTIEITNCGSGLKPGTYDYQIEQRRTQGSEVDSFIEVAGSLILKRNSVA